MHFNLEQRLMCVELYEQCPSFFFKFCCKFRESYYGSAVDNGMKKSKIKCKWTNEGIIKVTYDKDEVNITW